MPKTQYKARHILVKTREEAEAIIALGNTGAGPPADHSGHSASDPVPTVPLSAADASVFDSQWRAAQQAIPTSGKPLFIEFYTPT